MYYNGRLKNRARSMRREMTKHERKLWYDFLRNLPVCIYRQRVMGNYIADFYCPQKNIIIELDGSQHFEDCGIEYDKTRDEYFLNRGITVLRYANNDIDRNFEGVCADILIKLGLR